jgi:hypothetical protein
MKLRPIAMRMLAACVLLLSVRQLSAADPTPIHWTATATTAALSLTKGAKVTASVTATIALGWHLYAFEQQPGGPSPTSVSLVPGQPFIAAGNVGESTPKAEFDSNFNMSTSIFEDKAIFTVPARTVGAVPASAARLMIDVAYQTCNDRMCLPLTVEHLAAPIHVGKAH